METWGVFFLGVIALASIVQGAFLIGLVVGRAARAAHRRAAGEDRPRHHARARQLQPGQPRGGRDRRPRALQARRVDLLLADTVEKIEETTAASSSWSCGRSGRSAAILAFLKGLQRGMDVYLKFDRSAHPASARATARTTSTCLSEGGAASHPPSPPLAPPE